MEISVFESAIVGGDGPNDARRRCATVAAAMANRLAYRLANGLAFDDGGLVARIGFSRNLGARADQAGLLVAAVNAPTTFQRTLMPRPLADQAIVTGLSVASNHALVALLQEVIQATAFVLARPGRGDADDATWGRLTFALDAAAFGAGI